MSVIQYQCDICNRIIDIPQNKHGMEAVQHCVITDGCHGKLSQINIKLDHIRGNFPTRIDDLEDYVQRKILYNHKQSIKLTEWNIIHNLGVSPFVQIFIERPKILNNLENVDLENSENLIELIEVEPDYIKTISINEMILGFNRPEKGIAQLIAKTSNKDKIKPSLISNISEFFQLSNKSEVNIATLSNKFGINPIDIEFNFYSPEGEKTVLNYVVDDNPSILSSWVDFDKIYNGKSYVVRSFNLLDNSISNIENGSSFVINTINNIQVEKNDLIFLLTKFPYKTNDKILDSYVDISNILESNSTNITGYNDGELSINQDNIIKLYPHIKQI
jgi:hypothetical protein